MLSLSFFATCHPKRVAIGRVSSAATKIALLRATATPVRLHSRTKRTVLRPPGQGKLHKRPRPDSRTKGTGLLLLRQVRHPTRPWALVPKNNCVHKLNPQIQNMLSTNSSTYKSVDVVIDPSQSLLYPLEFLNSHEPTGIPPRNPQLRVGVPIILLRNLDPPRVLCEESIFSPNRGHYPDRLCKREGCIHSTDTTYPYRLALRLQKDTVLGSPRVCNVHQQGTRTIPENCGNLPAKSMFLTWATICRMF
jgi:hypothetical protein